MRRRLEPEASREAAFIPAARLQEYDDDNEDDLDDDDEDDDDEDEGDEDDVGEDGRPPGWSD